MLKRVVNNVVQTSVFRTTVVHICDVLPIVFGNNRD